MAAYDCKECEYHYSYGNGKCKRFEYNCPFSSLVKGEQREEVRKAIKDFKKILDKFKTTYEWGDDYSPYQMYSIAENVNILEETLNEELYKEWLEISEEYKGDKNNE